jgi:hypothetical protein
VPIFDNGDDTALGDAHRTMGMDFLSCHRGVPSSQREEARQLKKKQLIRQLGIGRHGKHTRSHICAKAWAGQAAPGHER